MTPAHIPAKRPMLTSVREEDQHLTIAGEKSRGREIEKRRSGGYSSGMKRLKSARQAQQFLAVHQPGAIGAAFKRELVSGGRSLP